MGRAGLIRSFLIGVAAQYALALPAHAHAHHFHGIAGRHMQRPALHGMRSPARSVRSHREMRLGAERRAFFARGESYDAGVRSFHDAAPRRPYRNGGHRRYPGHETAAAAVGYPDGRPADCYGIPWCGCWLRHVFGLSDKAFNRALAWLHFGHPSGPQIGAVVVWSRGGGNGHVAIIRGGPDAAGRWLVESGNDGHGVRTRYRSLAGAIAFRAL